MSEEAQDTTRGKGRDEPQGLTAEEAKRKIEELKTLALKLSTEVLLLEERVAPKLVGKDAALLPVLY